jgi:hypothetical protein
LATGIIAIATLLGIGAVTAAPLFERPVPEGGGPTKVLCGLAILDVDEISDANQNFTVNLFARFRWHDPREAHSEKGMIVKDLNEVWHPRLFFANMQRTWSTFGGEVVIHPDGEILLRQQFWGDFSQPMDLRDFPFDQHAFEVRAIAIGRDELDNLELVQDPEGDSFIAENYSVADWKVLNFKVTSEPLALPNGDERNSFSLIFTARRLSNHYLIKIIAPLLMIVILSWVVFWLDPTEGGSQLGVAVTSFLTVIAFHMTLSSKLPEISYLTRLDVFVFGATFLVFLAMIEVVITTGLARSDRVVTALWVDRVCRLIFPGALTLVGLYAYAWH